MEGEKIELIDIEEVGKEEIDNVIEKRRQRLYPHRTIPTVTRTCLVGVALSGGGIRSAVTNLGVLYEMSRVGLLKVVDYLSTVSGGGYIGCCLISLLSLKKPDGKDNEHYSFQAGSKNNEESLFSTDWKSFPFRDYPVEESSTQNGTKTEYGDDSSFCTQFSSRDQVFHLRNRASYLVPSTLPFGSYVIRALGAVSGSTLMSLFWFFSLIVLVTTIYMALAFPTSNSKAVPPGSGTLLSGNLILETAQNNNNTTTVKKSEDPENSTITPMERASVTLAKIGTRLSTQATEFNKSFQTVKWYFFFAGTVWGVIVLVIMNWRGGKSRAEDLIGENLESYIARKQLKWIFWSTVALLLGVLLFSYLVFKGQNLHPDPRLLLPVFFVCGSLAGSLIMLCILAGAEQEKMSKLLLWKRVSRAEVALATGFFIYCLGGSIVFAVLPAFILEGNAGFIALTQAVLILLLRFYLAEERKKSEVKKQSGMKIFLEKGKTWLLWVLVPLFVILCVVGTAAFLGEKFFGTEWPGSVESTEWLVVIAVGGAALLLAIIFSHLNFNNISPHVFYKDRLAEAFLITLKREKILKEKGQGAYWMAFARNAVEMPLSALHGIAGNNDDSRDSAARGPYLLINATLNLTAARDVAGFRRQSENFLFSRYYVGSNRTGFLKTSDYSPPISLGRAMTISGAAFTSVMGAKGSLAASFACTILGLRLGYWLRNPIKLATSAKVKNWHWRNLYYELFRYTNSRHSHVYLSDGGHCGDNLGLLALFQRRTKLIIASDADCDPEYLFNSLNNSIRRAYVDNNIKVHICLDDLTPGEDNVTKKHFAVGRILYPERPWQKSWLLVIKNTFTGKESAPIRNYRKKSPAFPHETTADQFFTEEQFEVYRSLGRSASREIWENNIAIFRSEKWLTNPWACIDEFCLALTKPGDPAKQQKEFEWDDIIKAIWSSERGDFSTWNGFRKTVEKLVTELRENRLDDGSEMVQELRDLHQWLTENNEIELERLDGKHDIPRNWTQFEEIKNMYRIPPENEDQDVDAKDQ